MKKIIVEVTAQVDITAKAIEDKWNYNLKPEDKIKATELPNWEAYTLSKEELFLQEKGMELQLLPCVKFPIGAGAYEVITVGEACQRMNFNNV